MQYYTLAQAAKKLNVKVDHLRYSEKIGRLSTKHSSNRKGKITLVSARALTEYETRYLEKEEKEDLKWVHEWYKANAA